jgi:hypothetical protein
MVTNSGELECNVLEVKRALRKDCGRRGCLMTLPCWKTYKTGKRPGVIRSAMEIELVKRQSATCITFDSSSRQGFPSSRLELMCSFPSRQV